MATLTEREIIVVTRPRRRRRFFIETFQHGRGRRYWFASLPEAEAARDAIFQRTGVMVGVQQASR